MLPLLLACSDYGVARHVQVQSWTQPAREGGVDIVWVIDDSSSMLEEQEQLATHADSFISFLTHVPVDFRLVVVTTDPDTKGTLNVMTGDTPYLAGLFSSTVVASTYGTRDEQAFDMALWAASPSLNGDFARKNADLEVIIFSDEDDHSDINAEGFVEQLRAERTGEVVVNAIVGDLPEGCVSLVAAADPGAKHVEAQELTGGAKESICSSDYGALLERVALHVLGLENEFALTELPELDSLEARVDEVLIHRRDRHGWHYEAGENLVVLDGYSVPPPGSTFVVRYFEWYGLEESLEDTAE